MRSLITPLNILTLFSQSNAVAPAPENTVAPALSSSSPVIGTNISVTPGTWTGEPSLTYQWQYQDNAGDPQNISGATGSDPRPPVDTDFGYPLRMDEYDSVSGTHAYSDWTSRVAEAPVQTLGSEIVVNGNFANWTTDNPDSWTVSGESGSDPMVTQVGSDGNPGSGSARLYSSATANNPVIQQGGLSVGSWYEWYINVTAHVSGAVRLADNASTFLIQPSTTGIRRYLGRAGNAFWRILGIGTPNDNTVDDVSIKLLTFNTELVAPDADMVLDFFYTLPGTPREGDAVMVFGRISSFSSGNYWLAMFRYSYTGNQWNAFLYKVASHSTGSNLIAAATNIGATDGIRFYASGDTIRVYSTANGGTNWTQRGSDVTDSTYNTATGVNVAHTSAVTPGSFTFTPG